MQAIQILARMLVREQPQILFNDTTPDGCVVGYIPKFLSALGEQSVLESLHSLPDTEWSSGRSSFGHMVPRLIRWYGPASYRFAGRNWEPRLYESWLTELQAQIQGTVTQLWPDEKNAEFKSVLVNKYRSGHDSIAAHADAEPQFGENPGIASLSLGENRTFHLRHRQTKKKWTILLESGSLLFMGGTTQKHCVHWIDKEPQRSDVRYNLTFRPYQGNSSKRKAISHEPIDSTDVTSM